MGEVAAEFAKWTLGVTGSNSDSWNLDTAGDSNEGTCSSNGTIIYIYIYIYILV